MGGITSRQRENIDVNKNSLFNRINAIIQDSRYIQNTNICEKIKNHIFQNQQEYEPILRFCETLSSLAREDQKIWLKALHSCSTEFIIHSIYNEMGKEHLKTITFWFENECNSNNKKFEDMAELARTSYTAYCDNNIITPILEAAIQEIEKKKINSIDTLTASSSSSNYHSMRALINTNFTSLKLEETR